MWRRAGGSRGYPGKQVGRQMLARIPFCMPIFFECQRCTACCRWPGQVRLTDAEISRIASYKGLSEFDFIQQFTQLRSDRGGLVLMNKPTDECIFLEGQDCAVQPVKPQQCLDFPNGWNFPGFEKVCQAVPRILPPSPELEGNAGQTSGTGSAKDCPKQTGGVLEV